MWSDLDRRQWKKNKVAHLVLNKYNGHNSGKDGNAKDDQAARCNILNLLCHGQLKKKVHNLSYFLFIFLW